MVNKFYFAKPRLIVLCSFSLRRCLCVRWSVRTFRIHGSILRKFRFLRRVPLAICDSWHPCVSYRLRIMELQRATVLGISPIGDSNLWFIIRFVLWIHWFPFFKRTIPLVRIARNNFPRVDPHISKTQRKFLKNCPLLLILVCLL